MPTGLSDMGKASLSGSTTVAQEGGGGCYPGSVWVAGPVLYPALQSPVCVFLYLDVLGLCVGVHSTQASQKG